jgi:hypothetical protein
MCGCKGCQEITTLDLANNTETITQLPTPECGPIDSTVKILTCECGITLDIYNGAGILVESVQSGGYNPREERPIFFEFTNSTVWESQLGTGYVLTITYNSELSRWELSYFNEEIDDTVLIGFYYTENTCPTAIQGWDLSCISFAVSVLIFPPPTFINLVTWDGVTYVNGKKSYSFSSDWSGPTYDYIIEWDIAPLASGAPAGTQCWILYEDQGTGFNPIQYIFQDTLCPFGQWQTYWESETSRFFIFDLGVTGYNIKVSPIDCQCCDEKLTITTTISTEEGLEEVEVIANIVTNSAGNHLIYNGYPYYTFVIDSTTYYLFYLNGQWVVKLALSISSPTFNFVESTNECPFGYYSVGFYFTRFWVRGYNCGDQVEKDFCEKVHEKQCEFATKTLNYLKHLQFGNTCCEELDNLKNDRRILEILNCYDTRDIPSNTTDYNTIPYIQIKRLLGC